MRRTLIVFLLISSIFIPGCVGNMSNNKTKGTDESNFKIARKPSNLNFGRGKLNEVPSYNVKSNDNWQVDLRSYDLSSLDISDKFNDLIYADFDSKTNWPSKLPESFNPEKIMELGKNPGLQIRDLHSSGITGKGVGIAIIDQALLVDHEEYKESLKLYEEIHWPTSGAQMHGSAVASIAVGKTVGVAPNANLYYIAEMHGETKENNFEWDFTWLAKSIDRILEINADLPKEKKIRVISISVGWDKSQNGYQEVTMSVERAKKQGIFVISSSLFDTYGYFFNGLGRNPLDDPDSFNSYRPGLWWQNNFFSNTLYSNIEKKMGKKISEVLLVPMDSRCVASPTGNQDYVFYRNGGWSWSIPYLAGLYALACQVNPDITPDIFWNKALRTGDTITFDHNGSRYPLEKVVNPEKLISSIKN